MCVCVYVEMAYQYRVIFITSIPVTNTNTNNDNNNDYCYYVNRGHLVIMFILTFKLTNNKDIKHQMNNIHADSYI